MTGHPRAESMAFPSLLEIAPLTKVSSHDPDAECVAQERGDKDNPSFRTQSRSVHSSSRLAMQASATTPVKTVDVNESEGDLIESIRDVVEQNNLVIPFHLTETVCIRMYTSVDSQPVFCAGKSLSKLMAIVERLLNRGANISQDSDMFPPRPSIPISAKKQERSINDPVPLARDLHPGCQTTETSDQLEGSTDRGHAVLLRCSEDGDIQDLQCFIGQFGCALNACLPNHPCRVVVQSNVEVAVFIGCRIDHDLSFNFPAALCRNALPISHPDHSPALPVIQLAVLHLARSKKQRKTVEFMHEVPKYTFMWSHLSYAASSTSQVHVHHNMGTAQRYILKPAPEGVGLCPLHDDPPTIGAHLVERFRHTGDLAYLQQAISTLEPFVQHAAVSDCMYLAGLANFGIALMCRFQHLGELDDLDKAILKHKGVIDLIPDGHPEKSSCLNNLGICFLTRFSHLGKLDDLDQAISCHKEVVDLTPDHHPDKADHLDKLATSLRTRFGRSGDLSDLDQAISRCKEVIDFTPDGHPKQSCRLNTLGQSYFTRFSQFRELVDLDNATLWHRNAVLRTPRGHPHEPSHLQKLGICFLSRFEKGGEENDLDHAISIFIDVIDVAPDNYPSKFGNMFNLGSCFFLRYQHLGHLSDLEEAISRLMDGVNLASDGSPYKSSHLNHLGLAFMARFRHTNELDDLEHAISSIRDAVRLTFDDHPAKRIHLSNFGLFSITRFMHFHQLNDLENAISSLRHSADLVPDGHPVKPNHLRNLGTSIFARFELLGEVNDIEQAISLQKKVLYITAWDHPQRPIFLGDLASLLSARFRWFGELNDIEQAISKNKEAIDLAPIGHPNRLDFLQHLANCYSDRFSYRGDLDDLELAIWSQKCAVQSTSGYVGRASHLSSLGNFLRVRFERLGDLKDLENATLMLKDSVYLTPDTSQNLPVYLNDLGVALRTRFTRLGKLSDLDEAIAKHQNAINITPEGDIRKPCRLNTLGNCFMSRFECLSDLGDLERARLCFMDAVDRIPDDHPHKPHHLINLGNSLLQCFCHLGQWSDLEQAISKLKHAVDLTPEFHSDKPARLESLARALRTSFHYHGGETILEEAMLLHSRAACTSVGHTAFCFGAARNWISAARTLRHDSILRAYSVAVGFLPQLAWIGLTVTQRYHQLLQAADVVREAAAAALELGQLETAVEWLEQGRSIVWGEALQLRSSYEELSVSHPEHALKLRELSIALECAGAAREKCLSSPSERPQGSKEYGVHFMEPEADKHRALAIERDKLLCEIRGFPGFERFLLHTEFSRLRAAAHFGPVVILNAVRTRCDALIISADKETVIHVPLPRFDIKLSMVLQNTLDGLLGSARVIHSVDRAARPASRDDFNWEYLLSTLWTGVVKPVLDVLNLSTTGDLTRIFWCPTGPFSFLPFHAAGLYGVQYSEPGHKVFDYVISSYVPTLGVLLQAGNPSVHDTTASSEFSFLAVPQPHSDGQSPLPGVHTELEHIKVVIGNSSAVTTLLQPRSGTVEEVLDLMKGADWVHFACHGIQDSEDPSDSGLCLADGRRLRLSDMVSLSRPRGGLAFLSACQTAMGNKELSDEAVHVAAGMLFSGYGGVIGTMWSISDRVAPEVAKNVYEELLQTEGKPDHRGAARALHNAVARLRNSRASFVEWVPFIHVGL